MAKFPQSLTLNTSRCHLRIVSREDAPHTMAASRYPGFNDGMLWEPPQSEEELLPHYLDSLKAWDSDRAYGFTIEDKDGKFIGRCAIRREQTEGIWNLGFWTHPEQQGQGYMTEAVAALLHFGFTRLGAAQIIANHALWNKASERVLQKNGLRFLRFLQFGFFKNGQWVEENQHGITLDEWQMRQTS
ncbi:GNAT family N-acetyltransferase [Cerasicoccus arenae]|uniref:N-acetyltransferase domain-containing protein n=1 Tax=Cerasicoccus arenae TaxID=424488 RepID=A0A8J3DJX9_9BACT|nr:GNAT family N-acetyltransferase [Cerasicoccus arenae]MBK1859836.1 GNAT family N-acetyltransferase [Cerasicoccus arenae]GHC08362.1 hypothetical protein GCM10007047_27030 [Cerasicoccus arenae]